MKYAQNHLHLNDITFDVRDPAKKTGVGCFGVFTKLVYKTNMYHFFGKVAVCFPLLDNKREVVSNQQSIN
jgi:hypothetical protein